MSTSVQEPNDAPSVLPSNSLTNKPDQILFQEASHGRNSPAENVASQNGPDTGEQFPFDGINYFCTLFLFYVQLLIDDFSSDYHLMQSATVCTDVLCEYLPMVFALFAI